MLAKQNDQNIFKRARCGVCKSRAANEYYTKEVFGKRKESREINEQKTKKVSDRNGISGVHSNKSRL